MINVGVSVSVHEFQSSNMKKLGIQGRISYIIELYSDVQGFGFSIKPSSGS